MAGPEAPEMEIGDLVALCRKHGARLHVDAVQAVGKLDLAPIAAADTMAVAAHKLGGPKGIGALVTRPGVRLTSVLSGGSQERGLRPGTLPVALIVGFGVAAELAERSADARRAR